jgi:hypothetical protein
MPTNDEAIFGPIASGRDVKQAIKATLQEWMPTYLALMERHTGRAPRSLPMPRSYVMSDDGSLNKKPEDQLPVVVILTPGNGGKKPARDGRGIYKAGFVVNVACIVSGGGQNPQEATSDLAEDYRTALELILLHHGSLGGFAESTEFQGWRTDDLAPEDDRTIAAGVNVFEVLVKGIAQHGAGLKEPLEEPYEETEPTTITEVDVEVEAKGP